MSTHKLLDPEFIDKIIFEVKSQGHFDSFRKECLADVDTQPAYQNLHSRVEDTVQRFLNRQVWTPEIKNKIRLREEMRMNIIRAGFLDSGVSRIVDQVVEQHRNLIQSKVEEILYKSVGIEKPKKEEKNNGSLSVDTTLLPTDLEQVSPDSDKKSSNSAENKEEIEEEIVEDEDDLISPEYEPIEPLIEASHGTENACQNSHNSNLSEISGLTSQDSAENKSHTHKTIDDKKPDTTLSQISSTQDNITDITDTPVAALTLTGISGEEAQMAMFNDSTENENVAKHEDKDQLQQPVFQFDLNKDTIEFTGTERKSINLDDSTNSGESEKVIQPQHIQPMEVDNTYENDTDSSEMRMEIDLKDESTQETGNSSKIEESSQDSLKNKEKRSSERSERSKDRKSSRSHHHHSSSSSKSRHEDSSRNKTTHSSSHKSSSSSHKKSLSDRDKSSSGRKDRDNKKSDSSKSSRSKHDEQKPTDDHHQEKSAARRRRSTDHDSNDSKDNNLKSKDAQAGNANASAQQKATEEKSPSGKGTTTTKTKQNEKVTEKKTADVSQSSKAKQSKSSILIKYDYLKIKERNDDDKIEDGLPLRGFDYEAIDEQTDNKWFKCMQLLASNQLPMLSNNNYINNNKKQDSTSKKAKLKVKNADTTESNLNLNDTTEESAMPQKSQITIQQQRYDANDLYKPKFDFRRGRRGQIVDEHSGSSKETAPAASN